LAVPCRRPPDPAEIAVLPYAAGWLAVVGMLLAAGRLGIWGRLLDRRPYALTAALGLAWWWWLRPGTVGAVLLAFSALGWIRQILRRARRADRRSADRRPGGSVVLSVRSDGRP